MKAIILAAGKGGRLSPVLTGKPKCLLSIGGKSLLMHQIDAMAACGISQFTIVVGYQHQQIRDAVATLPYQFTFVQNDIFERTNTLYSLWMARDSFDSDFVYFNADILCDVRTVQAILTQPARSQLACIAHPCGDEEVKVMLSGNRITAIGKDLDSTQVFGEFIGVARFSLNDNKRFAEILTTCVQDTTLWTRYFEHAVNILAQEKELLCADITLLPATEIDFPEDLENARTVIVPQLI